MFETIIESYYEIDGVVTFNNYYTPDTILSDTSVIETVDFVTLYDVHTNKQIGTAQFNNINKQILGTPTTYFVIERISIQINNDTFNNSSLFVSNYYKSINNNYYPTGTKYIISIASGTGDFATKTGYVVIDALENKRLVTIGLHKD